MNVVVVTHASNLEGAERSLLEVLERLKKAGHGVMVVVRETGGFTSALDERNIVYHQLKYGWWTTEGDGFPKAWRQKVDLISAEIAQVASEFKADLIYTNTAVVPYGALAAIKLNVPHLWHIRELASGQVFDSYREALGHIGSFISLGSNLVVFNSKATKNTWLPYLRAGSRTDVVYNPFPAKGSPRRSASGSFTVAVIGSILPIKNQMEAVMAFSTEDLKATPIQLEIMGPVKNEAYYESLQEAIKENDLDDTVSFKGYRDDPYAEAPDLCLVCGNSEGFGRVTAEAVICGIPVLAAKGGATDELIREGETGFLYEPGDTNELAKKIIELSNKDLRDHVKGAKEKLSALLREENTLEKLIGLMEDVSQDDNGLAVMRSFLDPYEEHKEHLKFIRSADLLKEVVRRKLGS